MGSANELTSAVAVELNTTHPQRHAYKKQRHLQSLMKPIWTNNATTARSGLFPKAGAREN